MRWLFLFGLGLLLGLCIGCGSTPVDPARDLPGVEELPWARADGGFAGGDGGYTLRERLGASCVAPGNPLHCPGPTWRCETTLPGGYCTRACESDEECPTTGFCYNGKCVRACETRTDCREIEGYGCYPTTRGERGCWAPLGASF